MQLITANRDAAASGTTPVLSTASRARLAAAGPLVYRVLDAGDRIIGHLQLVEHPLGTRYRARRFQPATARFLDLGDFWSPDEAVSCLRNTR